MAGVLGGFLRANAGAGLLRTLLLLGGLLIIYAVSKSEVVDRRLSRLIGRVLDSHTELHTRDFERLLHLAGEYSVKETLVEGGSALDGRSLGEMRLGDEGIVVLAITRTDGGFVPTPGKETAIAAGDSLIVYGRDVAVAGLGSRPRDANGGHENTNNARDHDSSSEAPPPEDI